jgi:hypothetical protein
MGRPLRPVPSGARLVARAVLRARLRGLLDDPGVAARVAQRLAMRAARTRGTAADPSVPRLHPIASEDQP